MQLTDHSGLRRHGPEADKPIEIPLNGQVYFAVPEVPVHSIMTAIGQSQKMEDIADQLASSGVTDLTDEDALQRLTEQNPALALKLGVAGTSRAERAVKFMQDCLLPESLARWVHFMWPANPEWPEADREAHAKSRIILPQLLAVFNDLVAHYSGGRPTEPSLPSSPGHGGTGGSSTAATSTEPVAEKTPFVLPPTVS